jgi:hypothetical protein
MAIEYLTVQYFQKLLKNILFVTSYRIKTVQRIFVKYLS